MAYVKIVVAEIEQRGLLQPPASVVPLKETVIYTMKLEADIHEVVKAVNDISRMQVRT